MKLTSRISWEKEKKKKNFLWLLKACRDCVICLTVSAYLPVVPESRPGPHQFKINGLINSRHYLHLVGNNQIQLTLPTQKEVGCQQEETYFSDYQYNVTAKGLTQKNNAEKKIGLTFPVSKALVTSLMHPPPTARAHTHTYTYTHTHTNKHHCSAQSLGK